MEANKNNKPSSCIIDMPRQYKHTKAETQFRPSITYIKWKVFFYRYTKASNQFNSFFLLFFGGKGFDSVASSFITFLYCIVVSCKHTSTQKLMADQNSSFGGRSVPKRFISFQNSKFRPCQANY